MKVFVYGTLKQNCCNNHVIDKISTYICDAKTLYTYPMYKSKSYFPYLENQPNTGKYIKGEIIDVDEIYLEKLDGFEGVPDLYVRGKIMVVDNAGQIHECICYFKAHNTTTPHNYINEWVE